jgi:hypothetical protein
MVRHPAIGMVLLLVGCADVLGFKDLVVTGNEGGVVEAGVGEAGEDGRCPVVGCAEDAGAPDVILPADGGPAQGDGGALFTITVQLTLDEPAETGPAEIVQVEDGNGNFIDLMMGGLYTLTMLPSGTTYQVTASNVDCEGQCTVDGGPSVMGTLTASIKVTIVCGC